MIFIDLKYIHALSPRLDKFKKVRDYLYNFRCVYCGDSKKLETKARGYFYRKKEQMNFACHNCGKGTTLSKVIEYIDPDLYKEFVKEKFVGKTDEPEYTFETPKFEKKDPKLRDLIPINSLSEDHPRLVIPFLDEDGKVFAAQGRAFGTEKPKYLTVKFDDSPKIFGLERIDWDKVVYVVEGPIDSLFLDNALAVAGADFIHMPFDKNDIVVVLDNEKRSVEAIKKMEKLIELDYSLVIWPDNIKEKDINEMTLSGVQNIQTIIENNTFSGLQARVRLADWKRI